MVRSNQYDYDRDNDATTMTDDRFVVGLFDSESDADAVAEELRRLDFSSGDIDTINHGSRSGLIDDLTEHGVPEEHAHYYAEGLRRGGHLVTLETDDGHYAQAVEIMRRHGAVDISRRASLYREEGFTRFDPKSKPYTKRESEQHRAQYEERKDTLPVIEENVRIGKERVESGGVRIFSRETERPVNQDVRLRDEHVDVTRRKVDRPATEADLRHREGEMTIRETSERPVVSKDARVTEEVHIGKHADEHVEKVKATAKKRDVQVERVDKPKRP